MNHARCTRCQQRFYIGSKDARGFRCPLCRGRLAAARPTQQSDRPPLPFALTPLPGAAAGSYERSSATYDSLGAFVHGRQQRLYSRERDVGLRWRDGTAIYRAAWIEDTGELYLVQLGAPDEGGGHVELLAAGLEIEELEEAASGWHEAQDDGDHSLDWLRDRVRLLLARRDAAARASTRPAVIAQTGVRTQT